MDELILIVAVLGLGAAAALTVTRVREPSPARRILPMLALGLVAWIPLVGPVVWASYAQRSRSPAGQGQGGATPP